MMREQFISTAITIATPGGPPGGIKFSKLRLVLSRSSSMLRIVVLPLLLIILAGLSAGVVAYGTYPAAHMQYPHGLD